MSAGVAQPPTIVGSRPNLAFGSRATNWAARLDESLPIVTSDLDAVVPAFAEIARRRKAGQLFCAGVFIDDPRAHFALYRAAPPVLAQVADYDQRARLLDAVAMGGLALDGRDQRELERYDARYIRTSLELLVTADVVVTRSSVERERLSTMLGRRFLHCVEIAPHDPVVPPPSSRRAEHGAIVVWAPHIPAEACGIFAFALEEFRRPAIVVCGPGQGPMMRGGTKFVSVAEGAAALAQAAVVVDASTADPGAARGLAGWGIPLAAASCSGALDWLDGITIFDPWNFRTIAAAVSNALGQSSPRERMPASDAAEHLRRSLAHAAPPVLTAGPLVSVIVPTLNRRENLRSAIASIEAQTYDRLEIILVNDGGRPFEDEIHSTRVLRTIEYADNRGVSAAVNSGIAAARGTYLAILADDDLFCPDQITRLVCALERTGGDVAHGIEMAEHFERIDSGAFVPIGYSLIGGQPASPTVLQVCNIIGGPAILIRRATLDAVGPFDERAGHLMDFEMWLRMSKCFDFVHVDRVTAVMTMRDDTSQASAISGSQTASLYARIYELHPTARPIVNSDRERQIRDVEAIPIVRTLPQLRFNHQQGNLHG